MLEQVRAKLRTLSCFSGDNHYLGRYSIEKLHLFEQYQRNTSPFRVAVVLLCTPLPTFLVLTAMDIVPLNDPHAGPSHNAVAFVRSTVSHAVMTFFTLLPLKQALSLTDREYSLATIALIACCTSLTIEALCIPLAFLWRFPVPFREMIGLPIFLTSTCVYNFVFAGETMRRQWRRQRLQLYVPIVGVQVTLFYLFLSLSVGFAYLPLLFQTVMILIFPFIKIMLKRLLWTYAKKLDDLSTDVTICMLEISGALYQTVCMQFVTSPVLNVLLVITDFLQAIHEVHAYVGMDYLGDGRHTIATSVKIVESSLFEAAERRTARSTANTRTVVTTTEFGDESSTIDPTRDSVDMSAPFARKSTLRRTRRSSAESLSLATLCDAGEDDHASEVSTAKLPDRKIETQAKSVVMPTRAVQEHTAKGKRRRRLLDLDLIQVDQSGGRNASQGRISQDEVVDSGASPAPEDLESKSPMVLRRRGELPPIVFRSFSAKGFPTQTPLLGKSPSLRGIVFYDSARVPVVEPTTPPDNAADSPLPDGEHPEEPALQPKSSAAPKRTWSLSQRKRAGSNPLLDLGEMKSQTVPKLTQANSQRPMRRMSSYQIVPVDSTVTETCSPRTGRLPSRSDAVRGNGGSPVTPDAPVQSRRSRRRSSTSKSTSIDGIRICRRDQARILEQTLQLLFSSEVLLFAEYMEVVIPVLYALTIGSEWIMSNAKYNLVVMGMSSSSVSRQIWNALGYALLELVSMMAMYYVMRRKYGVSAMYQLAFVLERYWMTLQGKMLGSFIVVINALTVHQGTDFSYLARGV